MLDAVLISDLHLGSELCQVETLNNFLSTLPESRRLVLIGDVLENTEHQLNKQHWQILSDLRRLSDQLELIWIKGNHDHDAELVAHLVKAQFVPEYYFQSGDKRILCIHGDTWDSFLGDHPIITGIADWVYLQSQRVNKRFATRIKRMSKNYVRCVELVKAQAILYGQSKGVDMVVCGHTHFAEASSNYYNSGCWTDHHCDYLTVTNGVINLKGLP